MPEQSQTRKQPFRRNRRFTPRPKVCQFCGDHTLKLNYKNVDLLRRSITESGKIRPRRQTGTCAKHQRAIAREIKRARHIALLPFTEGSLDEQIEKAKNRPVRSRTRRTF